MWPEKIFDVVGEKILIHYKVHKYINRRTRFKVFIYKSITTSLNSQKMANFKTLKINQICYKYFNVKNQNVCNDVFFLEIHMK